LSKPVDQDLLGGFGNLLPESSRRAAGFRWRIAGPLDELAVDERGAGAHERYPRTSATRCGALTIRQRRCADSISLNAMASAAAFAPPRIPVSPVSMTLNERAY
jgi:hypothetical protein